MKVVKYDTNAAKSATISLKFLRSFKFIKGYSFFFSMGVRQN
jgi:hypothetical protein